VSEYKAIKRAFDEEDDSGGEPPEPESYRLTKRKYASPVAGSAKV
jgi:hypothetical protein